MSGFPFPEITAEMIDQLPEEQRGLWIQYLEQKEESVAYLAELEGRREYGDALLFYGSELRAAKLVEWADGLSDDEVRQLLVDNWSVTEAWGADARLREGMIGLLRRVAPLVVTDEENPDDRAPEGMLEIFRGNGGEDARLGHSWTLDQATARYFARQTRSPRGMAIGIYREDAVPSVWRAVVDSREILGYFNDRKEREVVVDPETLIDVVKIQEAR